jgi:hypothetical protein
MNSLAQSYPFIKFPAFAFPKVNLKLLLAPGLFFITGLIFFYVFQNSQIVSQTYLLHYSQTRLSELTKENESLEISSVKGSSLSNLEKLIKDLGLEKVDAVSFIQSPGTTVVAR